MSDAAVLSALIAAGVNAAAAIVGAVQWWLVRPGRAFWVLLRAGQIASVLYAVLVGVLAARGERPPGGLFWLYALLPVAVAFVAEQLRLTSARAVLDARGLEDAEALGRRPEEEQRSVVLQILRRELGVMALAAAVVVFLLLRAASTAS